SDRRHSAACTGPEADALEVPVGLGERLDRLFDACAADVAGNATYLDLRRTLADVLARPPAQVDVGDPKPAASLHARTDRTMVLEGLLDALGSSDGVAQIPKALTAAAHGDTALEQAGVTAQLNELDSIAWGMNVAVQCQEEFMLVTPDAQAAVARS